MDSWNERVVFYLLVCAVLMLYTLIAILDRLENLSVRVNLPPFPRYVDEPQEKTPQERG
jgi:hypothetical protein